MSMNITEQNALALITQIEAEAAEDMATAPQEAERLAATATDQLDGMQRLLAVAEIDYGRHDDYQRTIAAITAAKDRLNLAAATATLMVEQRPPRGRHANGAGILR